MQTNDMIDPGSRPAAAYALDQPTGAVTAAVGRYRWWVCALLFGASTINYIDRQVLGILKPSLQRELGWSEIDYADIVFSFQFAYAIGLLLAGRMIDRIGTRLGFAIAVLVWSLAAMAHAGATVFGPASAALLAMFGLAYAPSVAGFIAARFALGIGEAGNFPAAIRATAEDWQAALLTGIDVRRAYLLAFALGTALAGAAGTLVTVAYSVSPSIGLEWTLKALIVVVLAGLGSVLGTFVGGLVLGTAEAASAFAFGGPYREVIGLVIFVVVLVLRPRGLFGR